MFPIPGTRNIDRMLDNLRAAEITLTQQEVQNLDDALEKMKMSEVFGGSKVLRKV